MTEPCEKLQTALSDILKDLMSMSADVIKKSKVHLSDVETINHGAAERISTNVETLLQRVNTNVQVFMNLYNTAVNTFKETCKSEVQTPKRKLNLSLKRTPKSDENNVDLTNSDEETAKRLEVTQSSKGEEKRVTPNDVEDDVSDTDSQKSILNFDVPVTNDSIQGLLDGETDDYNKVLDELTVQDEKSEDSVVPGKPAKSMSFDFDDDDEMFTEAAKSPEGEAKNTEEHFSNHELLDILNRVMPDNPDDFMTESDGDEAVKILEDEISYSSHSDSDDSIRSLSSREMSDSNDDWEPSDSSHYSDTLESSEEEQEDYQLKEIKIDMKKKLDQMDDAEIDRLCDIENINKRKCLKTLSQLKKKRRKRIRLLSTSSSSLSSDISTNSSTPDLNLSEDPCPPPVDADGPDISDLADQLADNLAKEDELEISSDSDEDLEKTKEKEPNKKPPPKVKSDDDTDDAAPKPAKKMGSWRNDIFFGTSSSSESGEEADIVLNDPIVDKIDEDEDEDSKEETKLKIVSNGDTMIITDSEESNSDSDDSVTFVSEGPNDDSQGQRGRRKIRAILSDNELNALTQRAKNEEDERILRLEEHTKTIESIQSQREDLVLDVDTKTGTPLITVDYNLAKMLKPHQKEGLVFMWEACYESVNMLKTKPGTGCILAHCMGLGKTLQVITLVHTLFKHKVTNTKHVLVICPLSTVTNWKNEFRKTFQKLDTPVQIRRYFIVKGDVNEKIKTVQLWRQTEGVLVMSYESFQVLTNKKLETRVSPHSFTTAHEGLVDPGPDLIVCDEGHQLKNEKTLRSKALMQVKTKRRIVLTGTPLQNNLKEYYWMVNFVKPHLLGTDREYLNRFATPITNGQYHDSRPEDIKLMKKRTHVLNKLLKKTIHRVESGVLTSYLPEIIDYTVFIKLSPLQIELYQKYINLVTSNAGDLRSGYLADVMMLNINNLHPYTLQLHYNRPRPKKKKKKPEDGLLEDEEHEANERVPRDWFKELPEDASRNVDYSPKLRIILEIVDEAARQGDKVLIFGQRRAELDLLENFLKVCGTRNCRTWRPNLDYYRMDGETPVEKRDELCHNFNKNPSAKIFLLTHKVGGLGLNLTGANRVIMIGSNHNPSLDAQSMYRVYRFGQNKKCYVYRLLSLATMEEKIYHRCVVKLHLSGTVVDKLHFTRKITSTDLQEMYKVDFSDYTKERPIPILPTDKLLAQLLQTIADIYKYHPHNSLLENRPEDELTDEDKKLAWDEFNSMEEAAKLEARNVVNYPNAVNFPIAGLPIFPASLRLPYNRFGQYSGARANTSMVPNPVNNSVRGFIPRNFLPNGTPAHVPRILHRNNIRGSTPVRLVGNPAATNQAPQQRQNYTKFPASETLQNLRNDITKVLREQPRPGGATSSGEFNYSLNKLV